MGCESYEFLSSLSGGTNVILLFRERETSVLWVGKIFRNSLSFLKGCADLNDRAILAARLAAETGACIPEVRLIDFREIDFSPEFDRMLDNLHDIIIQNRLLLVRFGGISLKNFLKIAFIRDIRNLDAILLNFVFNLWFGNYDKKTDDYVIDSEFVCHSVDYSLSGPGFVPDNRLSIGAYFQTYDFKHVWDSGWAIADPLIETIRDRGLGIEFFIPMVKQVEMIPDNAIRTAFDGLSFYRYGTGERIDDIFFGFLLERREGIREAVRAWCDAGYPKGERIPED
jgi:hypothetical protein